MVAGGESALFRNPESSGAFVPTLGVCEFFSDSRNNTFSAAWFFGESRVDIHPRVRRGCPCSDVSVTMTLGDRWLCEFFLVGCFHALDFVEIGWRLNNIQQRDMSITSYTLKIKELFDSLDSIRLNVDDDEMVQICLGGLTPWFGAMRNVILAREKPPSFFKLQSMLLVEENHVRTRSTASEGHMLYTHSNGGRGRGQG